MSAMAAEVHEEQAKEEVDYMNYDFPEDAVILYQAEDGVVYQSKEESLNANTGITTYAMEYESVYLVGGKHSTGQFNIKNPHTIINTTQGTFRVDSEYAESKVDLLLTDGLKALAAKYVKPTDGEVRFSFRSTSSNLVIKYGVLTTKKNCDIRIMCWLW